MLRSEPTSPMGNPGAPHGVALLGRYAAADDRAFACFPMVEGQVARRWLPRRRALPGLRVEMTKTAPVAMPDHRQIQAQWVVIAERLTDRTSTGEICRRACGRPFLGASLAQLRASA